jgi:HK97 family phage major capsid protein
MPPDSLEAILNEAHALADVLDEPDHDMTDDERTKAAQLLEAATEAATKQKQAQQDEQTRANLERLFIAGEGKTSDELPSKPEHVNGKTSSGQLWTPAQAFMQSKTYKDLIAAYPAGIPESARIGTLPPALIPGGLRGKAQPVNKPDVVGLTTPPDRLAMPPFPWGPPLTISNVITTGTTQSDTVEFAQLVTATNAAAPVAEATDVAGATGLKPASDLVFTKITATVRTIAHWLAATKRSLADAGQLQTLIQSFLTWGIDRAEENQILNGDGTGENFLGILATPGVLTLAWPGVGTPNAIDQIRKGITSVTWTGLAVPNAIAMNVADAEAIDLAKDTQNRYYGNGPFGVGPNTLWGLPRIVSDLIPAKKAIVGDFRQAVLWDRETTTITASDSHASFFIQNLVAILAEERAAFGVFRPQAFCVVATAA